MRGLAVGCCANSHNEIGFLGRAGLREATGGRMPVVLAVTILLAVLGAALCLTLSVRPDSKMDLLLNLIDNSHETCSEDAPVVEK